MDLKQFDERTQGFAKFLMTGTPPDGDLPDFIGLKIAADSLAYIKKRVFDDGLTFTGVGFKPYTKRYKKVREAKGLQIAYKDFTFTTALRRSIKIITQTKHPYGVTVEIGSDTEKEKKKLEGNTKYEGVDMLELSKDEKQLIEKNTDIWLKQAWEAYFK